MTPLTPLTFKYEFPPNAMFMVHIHRVAGHTCRMRWLINFDVKPAPSKFQRAQISSTDVLFGGGGVNDYG